MIANLGALVAQAGDKGSDVDVASILGYIVVGAIVGVIARFVIPGEDPMGIIATILLGILGAVIGGWVTGAVFEDTSGVDWIASLIAAAALVLLWRAVANNRVRN